MHRSQSLVYTNTDARSGVYGCNVTRDHQGVLHSVFVYNSRYGQYAQLGYSYSKDNGKTWSTPEALTADGTTSNTYAYESGMQSMFVTSTHLHIFSSRLGTDFCSLRHFWKPLTGGSWATALVGATPTSDEVGYVITPILQADNDVEIFYGRLHLKGTARRVWSASTETWGSIITGEGGPAGDLWRTKGYELADGNKIFVYDKDGVINKVKYTSSFGAWSAVKTNACSITAVIEAYDDKVWIITTKNDWTWEDGVQIHKVTPSDMSQTTTDIAGTFIGFDCLKDAKDNVLLPYYSDSNYALRMKTFNTNGTTSDRILCRLGNYGKYFPRARYQTRSFYFPNKLDIVYDAGSNDLAVFFMMKTTANSYLYVDLTNVTNYTLSSGNGTPQYLVYDIYCEADEELEIGVDLICSDNSNLRDSGSTDQNGLNCHPNQNLGGRALRKWYTRQIPIPSAWITGGKTISYYILACEKDTNIGCQAYLRNIRITDASGVTLKSIYSGGPVTTSVVISANYTSYTFDQRYRQGIFSRFMDDKREYPLEVGTNIGPTKWQRPRQFPR